MFGRRRRAVSNPHANTEPFYDPSATSAAAQAYLARSNSSANLSAAAAAAALRSRPTTPTDVAGVQTKRTLRRSASVSSRATPSDGFAKPGLERRRSTSSMSGRSFRETSPGGAPRPKGSAPPVPAIPAGLKASSSVGRRPSSVQPMNRGAPRRVTGRGASVQPLGRGARGAESYMAPTPRASSRGSVNFSLPTNYQKKTSDGQWALTEMPSTRQDVGLDGNELIYDPNTRSLRTRADLLSYNAQKPVRRSQSVRSGRNLASADIPPAETLRAPAVQRGRQQPARQSRIGLRDEPSHRVASPRNSIDEAVISDNESDASEGSRRYGNRRPQISKMPSVVPEDRLVEEAEDEPKALNRQSSVRQKRDDGHVVSQTFLPRSNSKRSQHIGRDLRSREPLQSQALENTPAQKPDASYSVAADSQPKPPKSAGKSTNHTSPLGPNGTNHPSIRHIPPPRSISPRKSAMKRSTSPSSLSGSISDSSDWKKTKGVRVSFQKEEGGDATMSGNAWTEPKEGMGKKPVLPTFGSVKKMKYKDEERPLVKPDRGAVAKQGGVRASPEIADGAVSEPRGDPTPTVTYTTPLYQQSDRQVSDTLERQHEDKSKDISTPAAQPASSHPIAADTDSSDGESIYSDAAENLDDDEGFMSLDAVIETPPTSSLPTSPQKSSRALTQSNPSGSWEESQRYWGGLSTTERRRMEERTQSPSDRDGPQRMSFLKLADPKPKRPYQSPPGAMAGSDGAPTRPLQTRKSFRTTNGAAAGAASAAPAPRPSTPLHKVASADSESSFRREPKEFPRSLRGVRREPSKPRLSMRTTHQRSTSVPQRSGLGSLRGQGLFGRGKTREDAESSEEEEGPRRLPSRFADSSDEESDLSDEVPRRANRRGLGADAGSDGAGKKGFMEILKWRKKGGQPKSRKSWLGGGQRPATAEGTRAGEEPVATGGLGLEEQQGIMRRRTAEDGVVKKGFFRKLFER